MGKCVLLFGSALLLSFLAGACGAVTQKPKQLSAIENDQDLSPTSRYRHECWLKRGLKLAAGAAELLQKSVTTKNSSEVKEPVKPDVKDFDTVLKDGFLRAECVKDYMYNYGDMWGNGKFAYKFGKDASRSIIRYDVFVAKEDQKEMTPEVCFEFCRTIPNMGFFGMVNGRTCYCTPYYQMMAGDSSACDEVCPGRPTEMCGGKSKSQVFEMHMCDSAKEDLEHSAERAGEAKSKMDSKAAFAMSLSSDMQNGAADLQKSFGAMGDSAATNLMQSAKVFAGFLEHAAEYVQAMSGKLDNLIQSSKDSKITDSIRASEKLEKSLDRTRAKGLDITGKLEGLLKAASYPGDGDGQYAGDAKQYYPLMYFVDKAFVNVPSTCGGASVGTPKAQTSLDGCARACDEYVHDCVAFSYYAEQELCFLMSKVQTAFYYTGCKEEEAPLSFLQQPQAADVSCMVKFSEFEGTTLKPDPSGKCKQCLKSITKADRCFRAPGENAPAKEEPKVEEEAPPPKKEPEPEEELPPPSKDSSEVESDEWDEFEDLEDMDDWESPWDFEEGNNHDEEFDDEWDSLDFHARKHPGHGGAKTVYIHKKGKHLRGKTNRKSH